MKQRIPGMTERLFQGRVQQALRVAGFESYHTYDSRRSTKGFPDLIALHPGKKRILAIEVKTETGKVTLEQNAWLDMFSLCGVETWLLRPGMFDEFWESIRK